MYAERLENLWKRNPRKRDKKDKSQFAEEIKLNIEDIRRQQFNRLSIVFFLPIFKEEKKPWTLNDSIKVKQRDIIFEVNFRCTFLLC